MMTEEQIDRYEAFRRSSLQKTAMRKVRIAMPPSPLCAEAIYHQPAYRRAQRLMPSRQGKL